MTDLFPTTHYGHNIEPVDSVRPGFLIETDDRARVVIPGRRNERFLVHENEDGSLLLQPAIVVSAAQHEYDSDPELRELLSRATTSRTVRRSRNRRTA